MVRGKYAAKANGQRAQVAQNAAGALRGQLEDMRRSHAAEVAELKAELSMVQGQLLREVRNLAAAEVERVRSESRKAIESERADRRAAAEKIALLFSTDDVRMTYETYPKLAKLLGLEVGEFLNVISPVERDVRRSTAASTAHGDDLIRQQRTLPSVIAGHPGSRT